jgi:hypothetical protein
LRLEAAAALGKKPMLGTAECCSSEFKGILASGDGVGRDAGGEDMSADISSPSLEMGVCCREDGGDDEDVIRAASGDEDVAVV